ncbi:hypothetical protein [Sphaerospermopsis aphanizomenoides]|uniref:hypothetical protein n=1 Tax=Sphaerospermopsis aphanizomenoides TaxID=459663 RepID=UPI00187E0B7E|nr:hypothetical protein [Sphaerospermopsis aphanizomenoides]
MGFADYPPISQNITGVRSQEIKESGVRGVRSRRGEAFGRQIINFMNRLFSCKGEAFGR